MSEGHVLHRSASRAPPVAVRGEGIFLFDASGRRYVDACGGAAVSSIGHGHSRIISAIKEQACELEYVHTGFFTTRAAEDLASLVAEQAGGSLSRVWFTSSGSEATEAALKLARQVHLERGEPGRTTVIARHLSYHGNTLGALAAGGSEWRRAPYGPLLFDASFIEPCFQYRFAEPGESAQGYGRRAADALEAEILKVGPQNVMAFIAETVVGATAGAVPPVPGYLKRIREICDKYSVLLILDEVMCGSGRTGTFLSFEQDDVVPDIATLGKGLCGGYQPIGAVLCTSEIVETIALGSGELKHGQTYNAHPVGCAAALEVQRMIIEEGLLERVRNSGERLKGLLASSFADHPNVGDIRGRGLLLALELVADREAKRVFDPRLEIHKKLKSEAFTRGLLIYPSGGTADGRSGDHLLLAPPYNVTDGELEMIVELLGQAMKAVLPS